jgi:hypothetical protein
MPSRNPEQSVSLLLGLGWRQITPVYTITFAVSTRTQRHCARKNGCLSEIRGPSGQTSRADLGMGNNINNRANQRGKGNLASNYLNHPRLSRGLFCWHVDARVAGAETDWVYAMTVACVAEACAPTSTIAFQNG